MVYKMGGEPVTKKELSQLYWINREIEREKRRLEELEVAATSSTAKITGLPHVTGAHDKIGDMAILIAEQRDLVELKIRQSIIEYNRISRYIASVDDSYIRQAMTLRYIDGLPWMQVAAKMGGNNAADGCRKAVDRYLSGH